MILNGKTVADNIKRRLKEEIITSDKRPPKLIIVTIGDDPASKVYVRNKMKAAEEIGVIAIHFPMSEPVDEEYVKEIISKFNQDDAVDGIMVQLPLPAGYNERCIIDAIDPSKDVDGLTTVNIGRLRSGKPCLKPCTAQGIIDLCRYYNIDLDGKDVAIIGRSNIVGKPLADLMMAAGATVTQCHSHTKHLSDHTEYADIIVSAIGKPKFIDFDHLGSGKVVIDVGINRDENGKLCGDVDFDSVQAFCEHITPVPGGVGPMTVAELMQNVVQAWRINTNED